MRVQRRKREEEVQEEVARESAAAAQQACGALASAPIEIIVILRSSRGAFRRDRGAS